MTGLGMRKPSLRGKARGLDQRAFTLKTFIVFYFKIIFEKEAAITAEAFHLIKTYVKNLRTSA